MRQGLLPILLLCAGCATHRPIAEIPIEIRQGLPTVEVRVSGESFKLFLDLGGHQGISLTSDELRRAAVRFTGASGEFRNASGEVLRSRKFVAENVMLGDFPLGDVEGGESIFGSNAPPDRNGHIGMPVLGRYLFVTDYPARRIRFYESGDRAALERECGTKTFDIVFVNGIAKTIGSTEFGDREFLWDTGATHNVIRPSSLPADKAGGRRIDDGPPVATIRTLRLGNHDVGPQEFRVVPFGEPAVDAYLGTGLFASRKVCLDVSRRIGAVQ